MLKLIKKIFILLLLKNNKEYEFDEILSISKLSNSELIEILDNLTENKLLNSRFENDISDYPKQKITFYYKKTILSNEYLCKTFLKLLTALLVIIYYLKEIIYK